MNIPREQSPSKSDASRTEGSNETRSPYYKVSDYPRKLERIGCYMRQSRAGPDPDDVAFYQRLLQHKAQIPSDTMLERPVGLYDTLRGRSKTHVLVKLHFLLMQSVSVFYFRDKSNIQRVIDGLDDPWEYVEAILGPEPRPDHSHGLHYWAFDDEERRKLDTRSPGTFSYAVRPNEYFPYLTCEIKTDGEDLEIADRQNMHSMSIVLRSLVQLAEAAGNVERINRRVLGYSISHNIDDVRIYGYYPEVTEDGKWRCFRCPVAQFPIFRTEETRWKCYHFVVALDSEFLPRHIALVKELLAGVGSLKIPRPVGSNGGSMNAGLEQVRQLQQSLEETAREAENRENELKRQLEESRQQMEEIKQDARKREDNLEKLVHTLLDNRDQSISKSAGLEKDSSRTS